MKPESNIFPHYLKAAIAVMLLVLLACGVWFYRLQKQTMLRKVEQELISVTRLKAAQIAAWRKDQLVDADYIAKNPFLIQHVARFLSKPEGKAAQELRIFFQQIQKEHEYLDIMLLDMEGRVQLSLGGQTEVPDTHLKAMASAFHTGKPVLIDIHRGLKDLPHISAIAPIFTGNGQTQKPLAAIVLDNHVTQFLYPLIQSWPTTNKTEETLLVRRDGDHVLILNGLHRQEDTGFKLRVHLNRTDMPAVMAVLGKEGVVQGRDYRGIDVLAAILPIPDSPWFLVTKINVVEAFAEWRFRSVLILVLMLGAIVLVVAAGLVLWQRNLKDHYRAMYRSEAALRAITERHSITLKAIGDAVISTDAKGRVELMNPVAESLTGWTEAEARGKPIEEVFRIINEKTREKVESPFNRILREGRMGPENHTLLIRRDGRKIPISDSGAPIRDERGEISGMVLVFRSQDEKHLVRKMTEIQLSLIEYANDHSLDELLIRTLDEVGALVDSPIGFYHFVKPDQKELTIQQWAPHALKEFCKAEGKYLHHPIEQTGILAECLRQKKPIVYNDYASIPHKKGLPEGHIEVIRILEVPVIREGKVVAILGVGNKPTKYTQKDEETVSYLADVTWEIIRHKLTEEALRESEERFRSIFENNHTVMLLVDPETGSIVDANPAACNYYGWSRERLLQMNIADINTLSMEQLKQEMVRARQQKRKHFEFRHRLADGSVRDVEVYSGPIRVKERDLLYSLIFDITERKHAEERIALFSRIFEDSLNEIYLFDADTLKFTQANSAALRNLGYTMEELKELTPLDIKPEFTPESFARLVEPLRKGEKKKIVFETVHKRKDQSLYDVEVHLQLIKHKQEKLFSAIILDITERKQAEQERKKLEEQLFQVQKLESIGRLAGGVAHDFNNMLSAIIGNAELAIMKLNQNDPVYSRLQEILKAANRSKEITQQLLAFARKQTINPRVIDLNETVEGILKMLRRLIGEEIELLWKPGSALWSVKMDTSQIDQILANLVVNARDAISGVGKITIETGNVTFDDAYCREYAGYVPGDFVMLAISDNGCGMDRETLIHIFEPFFTTKAPGEGTGLGLATVYGIVKQNNGFINVYSEPGEGTTFKIYLPRHVGEAEKIRVENKVDTPQSRGETVLLVEDEQLIIEITTTMLEELGYKVLSAGTPTEALRLAREHAEEIHLLITDVVMPEMNGRELAAQIQSLYPGLRVLFMSGYTANTIAHRGVLDKGVNFIQKPFNLMTLALKVREVLDQS